MAGNKKRKRSKSRKPIHKKRPQKRLKVVPKPIPDVQTQDEPQELCLPNVGETCFSNSVVQAFTACNKISTRVLQFKPSSPSYFQRQLVGCLKFFFKFAQHLELDMEILNAKVEDWAKLVLPKLGFQRYKQADPAELVEKMLSALDAIKTSGDQLKLKDLFSISYAENPSECIHCGEVASNGDFSTFSTLGISVPQIPRGSSVQLEELLRRKFEDTGHVCTSGEDPPKKDAHLLNKPGVLVIQLGRVPENSSSRKLDTLIDIPENLELGPYVPKEESKAAKYQLFAVTLHEGPNSYQGHYKALVWRDNSWIMTNDAVVERVPPEMLGSFNVRSNAYLLWYSLID